MTFVRKRTLGPIHTESQHRRLRYRKQLGSQQETKMIQEQVIIGTQWLKGVRNWFKASFAQFFGIFRTRDIKYNLT